MQQYRFPLRKDAPHTFSTVFKNAITKTVIDLTTYQSVALEVKRQGDDFDAITANFGDREAGEANITGVIFEDAGEWTVQFVAVNAASKPVFGEPMRITVATNVRDLAADELPVL